MIILVSGTYWTDFASCTPLKRCQHYETWLLVVQGVPENMIHFNIWIKKENIFVLYTLM